MSSFDEFYNKLNTNKKKKKQEESTQTSSFDKFYSQLQESKNKKTTTMNMPSTKQTANFNISDEDKDKLKKSLESGDWNDIRKTLSETKEKYNLQDDKNFLEKVYDTGKNFVQNLTNPDSWEDADSFGDYLGIVGNSFADLGLDVAKGFTQSAEGFVDRWNSKYADFLDFIGMDKQAEEHRNQVAYDMTGAIFGTSENEKDLLFGKDWQKSIEEKSALGSSLDSVNQGIGNMAALAVGNKALGVNDFLGSSNKLAKGIGTGLSMYNSYASSYGNSYSEALRNGATTEEARKNGIINGFAESISEQIFDGIPGLKSAGWGERLVGKIGQKTSKYLGTSKGKIVMKMLDGLGEGSEEIISNALGQLGSDIANWTSGFKYGRDGQEDIKNIGDIANNFIDQLTSEDSLSAAFSATLSTWITNGSSNIKNNVSKNNAIKAYAKLNDMTFNETQKMFKNVVENRLNETTDETTNFKEKIDEEDLATRQLTQLLKQGNKQNEDVLSNLLNNPNNFKTEKFQRNSNEELNEKQQILYSEFENKANNTKDAHDFYNVMNGLQKANTTQQYHVTTTEELSQMDNGKGGTIIIKQPDGTYTMSDGRPYIPRAFNNINGNIYVNLDAGKVSGTQAVYHEIFEGFKKADTNQYNELKQMVKDVIGTDYQNELNKYSEMYGTEYTDSIEDEFLNDKFGEIAESEQFINKISDNRNILEKFIDKIKSIIKYITGNEDQKKLIKLQNRLENEFATRYKNTDFSKNDGNVNYSITNLEKFNNSVYNNINETQVSKKDYKVLSQTLMNYRNLKPGLNEVDLSINGSYLVYAKNNNEFKIIEKTEEGKKLYDIDGRIEEGIERTKRRQINDEMDSFDVENRRTAKENAELFKNNKKQNSRKTTSNTNGKQNSELNTRFSLIKNNEGRKLSKQQQEYFKNSKVRDANGNLQVYYNGSNHFNEYDKNKLSDESKWGKGIYLTKYKDIAEKYGDDIKESYVNITNPINQTEKTISFDKFNEFYKAINNGEEAYREEYDMYDNDLDLLWDFTNKGSWSDYADELKTYLGVDGLIINDNSKAEDMIIAFQSNQVKRIGNETPTSNPDITKSLSSSNELLPGNNKSLAIQSNLPFVNRANQKQTETSMIDYFDKYLEDNNIEKPTTKDIVDSYNKMYSDGEMKQEYYDIIRNYVDSKNTNLPIAEQKRKEKVINNEIERRIQKKILKQSSLAINTATKAGNDYLQFNRQQKSEFKQGLEQYKGMTKEQLSSVQTFSEVKELVSKYANKEITYIDEETRNIKKDISQRQIKVPFELKSQITDYNQFRKVNFGKLRLGNEGQNIDTVYQELNDIYPGYFNNATTEADMLYELSDFMNQDNAISEEYKLNDKEINEVTVKVFNELIGKSFNDEQVNSIQKEIENKVQKVTRKAVQNQLIDEMGITTEDLDEGKDIKSPAYFRTDPIRVNEKVFGYEVGQKINDATINVEKHNEAERIRFLNKERQDIKDLGIKAFSKESAAVQKYAEGQFVDEKGEIHPYGDKELLNEFKNDETRENIKRAANIIKNKYQSYLERLNSELTIMGYDPIPMRNNYMPHFQSFTDVLSKLGVPLNPESMSDELLPTDINGITDQFKPGKNWFGNALKRKGINTTYDAITGFDNYIEGASNIIYHTEDIQRYRALNRFIRETYGQKLGFENLDDLTDEEIRERIDKIKGNALSGYVAWLDEQANSLANKKGKFDRAAEEILGRKVYTVLETAKKQVGSNMTGFNVRSAMTNFASAIQGASKTNKMAFVRGTISTVKNIIKNDGMIDKSDFLTRRFGSDTLSKKLWQKASNVGQIFMTGSDYFTANQIWRSKYYENISKGLNEQESIKNADDFAARIMGDRSKGSTAQIFNSKTLGLLTQFQLEVNNQWSSLIHDSKMDVKKGAKTIGGIVFQMGQLFTFSYVFNNIMKSLTGSDVMIDPIDLLKGIFNPDDDDEKTLGERAEKALGDVVDDVPFASIFTGGGRIPVTEAFTGLSTFTKKLTGGTNEYGQEITYNDVLDDSLESILYWVLPTGLSQINKTRKGLAMYDENLPIAGSYTDSGKLRFEADTSTGGKIKAALFGQWSSKEAQEYLDKGYSPLGTKQIYDIKETGLTTKEYRNYKEGLKKQDAIGEKIDYIYNLPYTTEQKNVLANSVSTSKNKIDLTNYDDYGSYDEFVYANKNPEKYQAISLITNYKSYLEYNEKIKTIKDSYYDKDSRKEAVVKYINSLPLTQIEAIMLYKMAGGYSIKSYNNQIVTYLNNLDLSYEEKQAIYNQLFK